MFGAIDWTYVAVAIPSVLIAFTFHELGHGLMSNKLGDPTPRMERRLTLNPLAHLDPIGTLVTVVTVFMGFAIGWARPISTNPTYYKNRQQGIILTAVAGPAMNLALASLAIALSYLFFMAGLAIPPFMHSFLFYFILINIVLTILNLLPIPPLDGGTVLGMLLPVSWYKGFRQFAIYGQVILLAAFYFGALRFIYMIGIGAVMSVLRAGFGQDFVNYLTG